MKRKLPRLSGSEVVKILVSKLGFTVGRKRGSHVVLIKRVGGRKVVTVVPLHPGVHHSSRHERGQAHSRAEGYGVTPGGTIIEGIYELEANRIRTAIMDAVERPP